MKQFIGILILGALTFSAACSSQNQTSDTPNKNTAQTPATNTSETHKGDDEVPASVKALFPNAQSITKEHKDISQAQIASIEKSTGGKVPDTDHHSYFAFSTEGGTKKQIGAATIVKADGKDVVIVYESKGSSPQIKEIRVEGVAQSFLDQFKNKDHHANLKFGAGVKAQGVDEALAKAIASAVFVDLMTMETLYGKAHDH